MTMLHDIERPEPGSDAARISELEARIHRLEWVARAAKRYVDLYADNVPSIELHNALEHLAENHPEVFDDD